jgi:type IV pilus assembly protein PilV
MYSVKELPYQQRGAGFIEVLVALVILAIGLLGVMSMQARGLSSSQRAIYATYANQLAYDMADRILAYGASGADSGQYSTLTTVGFVATGDARVNQDQSEWAAIFAPSGQAVLPSGRGDITWDGTDTYTITIRWDDERRGVTTTNTVAVDCASNDATTTLTCFQMELRL